MSSSNTSDRLDIAGLAEELAAARGQLAATAEIVRLIASSPSDVQSVFDAIVANAARLCDATFSAVARLEGGLLHLVAVNQMSSEEEAAYRTVFPRAPGRHFIMGRAFVEARPVHVADIEADPDYDARTHSILTAAAPYRTYLGVPILDNGAPIGVIGCGRRVVRPFSDAQIALVATFADQAVIAIENARLLQAEQARTRELQEALQSQTATSEVLNVISRSPTQLRLVLDTIVETAARLCHADHAFIWKLDGGIVHLAATDRIEADFAKYAMEHPHRPHRGTVVGRALLEQRTVHIFDVLEDPEYDWREGQRVGGYRTVLGVPLLRAGVAFGAFVLLRDAVNPFAQKEIELVTTFADQAVIAIENARLFEAEQARTRELSRSVEELKALGEIGRAVNSSLELKVVLSRILEHACAMSDTGGGAIYVFDKARGEFDLEAGLNMSEEVIAAVRSRPIRIDESLVGQCAVRREAVQFDDLSAAPPHPLYELHMKAGVRALLAVPLVHQDELVGALVVRRMRAGAFAADTIALLQTFAAQSAIAVQNARLFHEIEQKSRELEIASQHKSQFVANMSHELRTPLAAILGYTELLQEGFHGELPDKAKATLARVQSNGKHLLGLINSVLDISKIEAGQFKLNLGEYAIDGMIETVRTATESLATAKSLSLRTEVERDLPYGFGDEQRLTQVLLNLVGNAIKFTDAGEVAITAGAADGRLRLGVSDTGPGIPAEERQRIFEKFHQIDSTSTRTKGGTGLGLAITREIVAMHGGRIWVDSIVGKGSTFRIELPIRAAAGGGEA